MLLPISRRPVAIASAAAAGLLLLPETARLARAQETPPNVCLLIYDMADNDLEVALFVDFALELAESQAIQQPNLNTWVYFDAHGGMFDYDEDGETESPFEELGDGAMYFNFNHEIQDWDLADNLGEVNSDDSQVLCAFVTRGLSDCVDKGATEFMLVFSSHGAGHGGFGGDYNTRGRRLVQANSDVVDAIQCGLGSVANAPEKFDVVGFDACLMSSLLATRDYSEVADYYLASEAVIPGHGWYWNLTNANGALSIARELHETYFTEPQNPSEEHLTPKTLALIDTAAFDEFLPKFEALAGELSTLLRETSDQELHTAVNRARDTSIAFDAYGDNPGTKTPSAVDIGSFISTFDEQCLPSSDSESGSNLRAALDDALESYNAMFVARDVGPGTPPATGMAVYFPSKKLYSEAPEVVDGQYGIIDDGDTSDAWIGFLAAYLLAPTPESTAEGAEESSVCGVNLRSDVEPQYEGQLLLNPALEDLGPEILVSSDITVNTDLVITEYGFHALSLLDDEARRRLVRTARRLSSSEPDSPGRRLRTLFGGRVEADRTRRALAAHRPTTAGGAAGQRAAQEDEELDLDRLIIYNGELSSTYEGPQYFGVWNKFVYLLYEGDLENDEDVDINPFVYANHKGDGAMAIPVLYFPDQVEVNEEILPAISLLEDALALGAFYGELTFAVDEATAEVVSPVSLFKNEAEGDGGASPIFEVDREAGGHIVPIVYAEVGIGDNGEGGGGGAVVLIEVVGFLHEWGEGLTPLPVDANEYSTLLNFDTMVFDMYAWDLDLNDTDVGAFDYYQFEYDIGGSGGETGCGEGDTDCEPDPGTDGTAEGDGPSEEEPGPDDGNTDAGTEEPGDDLGTDEPTEGSDDLEGDGGTDADTMSSGNRLIPVIIVAGSLVLSLSHLGVF